MAWFSGRLPQFSSLTDQISSFTKEVLTETTEEVEDPAAELQVARKKIQEIESLNKHIQTEWEKLQRRNEELGERADTAEYQIATISQEYRKLIQEKDNELRRLKAVNENLKEEQKRLLPEGGLTQSPLKELANMRFFPPGEEEGTSLSAPNFSLGREEFGTRRGDLVMGDGGAGVPVGAGDSGGSGNGWAEEEFHDFGDVISSQGEINRLQSELARVRVECQHWRTLAKEKMASSQSETGEEDVRNLHEQIKELQRSLQHEMEQHQRELTALQTMHDERMQSLSRRHELEVSRLQYQAACRDGDQSKKATETAPLLVREGATPEMELNLSPSRCSELEAEVSRLRNEVREGESARADLQRLRSEVDTLQSSKSSLEGTSAELSQRIMELEEERRVLEERVGEVMGQLEEVRREKEGVSRSQGEELQQAEARLKTTEELNAELQSQLQQMGSDRANFAEANSQLVAKLEKEQLAASQLRSEMETMKQLLVQERDAQIRHLEEEERSRVARLSEMQSSIRDHEACIARLQSDHEKSQEEADQLSSQVEILTRELEDKEAEIAALKGQQFQASEGSEDMQKRLEESETAGLRLRQEVSSLRRSEEELKARLAGMEKSSPDLQPGEVGSVEGHRIQLLEEQVWKLRSENERLGEELSKTQAQIQFAPPTTPEESAVESRSEDLEQKLQVESAKRKQLQDHLVRMSEEHDHELSQLVSEKEGLQDDLATLREELSGTLQLQNDSLAEGSQLKLENSQLFEDLSEQKETISKLRAEVEMLRSVREERELLPTSREAEQSRLLEAKGGEKESRQDSSGFDDIDLSLYQDPSPAVASDFHLVERLQGLEGVVAEKEQVIAKLRVSAVALESTEVSLRESVDGLKSEKCGLEEKLRVVEGENRQMVARLQGELEEAKRKAVQEVTKLESAIRNREEKVSELERETSRLKSEAVEREKMASEMLDLQAQLDDKVQTVSHHEQNLRELGEVLAAREREVEELRAQCKESRVNEGTLLTECRKLREEYAAVLEKMAHLEEEARSSKVELEAALRQGAPGEGSMAEGTEAHQREEKATLEQKCAELAQVVLERDGLIVNLRGREDELTQLNAALNQVKQQLSQSQLETANKKSEVEEFSRELTSVRSQLSSLRREKGELEARLGALEERGVAQQRELEGRLRTREAECAKYTKELERLRAHLMEVEEQHTQEAVGADKREAGLRQRVAELEEGLRSVSTAGAVRSQHSQQQVQDLEAQLSSQAAQHDHTFQQLARAKEEAQRNAAALQNLQTVLEQFQRDQSSELSLALKRSQTELADARQECQRLRTEQKSMQNELEEACAAAEGAVLLGQELEQREKTMSELTAQVEKLQSSLHTSQLQIDRLSKDQADKVDKKLVKNLWMGYFHASDQKKSEVVQLMGKILGFSQEELDQTQGQRSGWLSSFWKGRPPTTPTEESKSMSQLFVKFLEMESSPTAKAPSSPRTPTTASSSYIDPKTDPDRPSLATAAIATPVPPALPPHKTFSSAQHRPESNPLLPTFPTPKQAREVTAPTTASYSPQVARSGSWQSRQPPQPATPIVNSAPLSEIEHLDHTFTLTSKLTVVPPPTTSTLSDDPSHLKGATGLFTFSPTSSTSGPVPREDKSRSESFQSSILKSVLASHS